MAWFPILRSSGEAATTICASSSTRCASGYGASWLREDPRDAAAHGVTVETAIRRAALDLPTIASRRYALGKRPRARRNARPNADWSEKPQRAGFLKLRHLSHGLRCILGQVVHLPMFAVVAGEDGGHHRRLPIMIERRKAVRAVGEQRRPVIGRVEGTARRRLPARPVGAFLKSLPA